MSAELSISAQMEAVQNAAREEKQTVNLFEGILVMNRHKNFAAKCQLVQPRWEKLSSALEKEYANGVARNWKSLTKQRGKNSLHDQLVIANEDLFA